jgi:D-sedoheptulose 7-phosphate isomerase
MTIFNNIVMGLSNDIDSFLLEQQICLKNNENYFDELKKIINALIKARDKKFKIFTIGNGGSGSTASHFVSDLIKTASVKEKNKFSAFSLVDNIPVILAWSNDSSFDNIFSEQLKNHLSKNDIIIAFSGSGNSKNILNALKYGKILGATCIGFTGKSGGKMKKLCDHCLQIPSSNMLTIESIHSVLCHCIVDSIRKTGVPFFKYE